MLAETTASESLLVEPKPTTWPDGSAKPAQVIEDESWLREYDELQVMHEWNPEHAGFRRGVEELAEEAEIRGIRVLTAAEDQKVAEAKAEAEANPSPAAQKYVEYVEYWREDRRQRNQRPQSVSAPITLTPAPSSASARESRGSSSRSRGSRRSSSGDSDDGGGSDGSGGAGPHEICARSSCGLPVAPYKGRGRRPTYCVSEDCKKARSAASSQKHRACSSLLPNGMWMLPGHDFPHGTPGGSALPWDAGDLTMAEPDLDLRREPERVAILDEAATLWLAGDIGSARMAINDFRRTT